VEILDLDWALAGKPWRDLEDPAWEANSATD
jgi:hypothetical protein